MWFCGDSSSLECVRGWSTIAPAVLVLLIGLAAIPISISGRPLALLKTCTAPFTTYLTLQEAEALDADATPGDTVAGDEDTPISKAEASKVPLWRAVLFVSLGLVEALSWMSVGSYHLITESSGLWEGAQPFLLAFVWIYTTIRPIVRRSATPPYDLFSIYLLELVHGIFELGGVIYDHGVNGAPLPPASIMFALSANLAAILTLLGVVLAMPLAVPSDRVSKDDIVCGLFLSATMWRIRRAIWAGAVHQRLGYIFEMIGIPAHTRLSALFLHCMLTSALNSGSFCYTGRLHDAVWMDHIQLGVPSCSTRKSISS